MQNYKIYLHTQIKIGVWLKKNNFFRILIKKIWGICEKLTKNMKNVKLA